MATVSSLDLYRGGRQRFVYPTFDETTARAIEACEAAWEFFGGIFTVLIPDNTKAIVMIADPLTPRITPAHLLTMVPETARATQSRFVGQRSRGRHPPSQ
jgi:hypothetical protein